ncbi:MAG TPA: thioesterase family protein, partial [Nannocystis sp.]
MQPDAFYHPDGDLLVPTALTRGPWHIDHQHGGPPAALLARAIEGLAPPALWHPARFTLDFLRPVPVTRPLRAVAELTRRGKQVLGLTARLLDGDQPVASASALCIRRLEHDLDLPAGAAPAEQRRDPESFPAFDFSFFRWDIGYHTAVDGRLEAGEIGRGPATAWMRTRQPLVAGEPTSALQHVLIVADAINGVGFVLDLADHTFVNADLGVHLHRLPVDAWIRMSAIPSPQPHGVGLV